MMTMMIIMIIILIILMIMIMMIMTIIIMVIMIIIIMIIIIIIIMIIILFIRKSLPALIGSYLQGLLLLPKRRLCFGGLVLMERPPDVHRQRLPK